jgi:hypothetical protein
MPRKHRRGVVTLALALAAGMAAALLAFVLARSDAPPPAATPTPVRSLAVSNGLVRLVVTEPWREDSSAAAIPGLHLERGLALAAGDARILIGETDAVGPSLVPGAFVRTLAEEPRAERVELAGMTWLRYLDQRPADGPPTTVFVAPTTTGVLTIACALPGGWAASGPAAEKIVGTLDLLTVEALPPGADEEYAGGLQRALRELTRARTRADRELTEARTRRGQAASAGRLARAFGAAGTEVRDLGVSRWDAGVQRSIAGALTRASRGYREMSAAAARGREHAYDAARVSALLGERALARALEGLPALGYELLPPSTTRTPGPLAIVGFRAAARLPALRPLPRPRATPAPAATAQPQSTTQPGPTRPPAPAPAPRPTAPPSGDNGGGGSGGGGGEG